ncbi:MAG TPA: hypothetical protein VFW92_02590 [Candidatus Limnocylindrales bacterium]|nr:hypothetical protein [Candidatus Limnocylindrales bacterium]
MSRRRSAVLAKGVWVVGLITVAIGLAMLAVTWDLPRAGFAFPGFSAVVGATMLSTGAILALRRAENPIGWLFLVGGSVEAILFVAAQYATGGLSGVWHLPATLAVAWLQTWLWLPGIACMTVFTFLYFPTGRLPGPRWTWVRDGAIAGLVVACIGLATSPGRIVNLGTVDNPIGNQSPLAGLILGLGFLCFFGTLGLSVASLVVRSRRGALVERLQIKWLAYAACLVGILFVPATISSGDPILPRGASLLLADLLIVSVLLVPLGIMVAILRYRLYDIDRIVSRSVSYLAVTGILIAIYIVSIVLLTRVLPFGGPIGTAASVLVAVAFFSPIRQAVQKAVDRRFDRERYDAEATVAAFAADLQTEVDLEAMRANLVEVVDRTVHPAKASLWLRQGLE